jgi:hypothetical protein
MRTGVYPGSFDPPTRAHLEIARTARDVHGLTRVDLAVSRTVLGKSSPTTPTFEERVEVIRSSVAEIEGLEIVVTGFGLIADIAAGYDVVIMGADKWVQINDPIWYGGDEAARDAAVARLPTLALAPRSTHEIPVEHRLPVDPDLVEVSSTEARRGRVEWMTEAARRFDATTGAWTKRVRPG